MRLALAYLAGAVFGIGLVVSGMTDPAKVIGFLDVTQAYGAWDASLMFVMVGAIAVHASTRRWIHRRPLPVCGDGWHVPTRRDIDARLISGAAVFGVGWGLAGYCPGPGLVSAAGGLSGAAVFVATMIAGMLAYELASPRPELGQ
jgi:uncharacterized membrane protein YedE/YeeE